MPRVLLRLRSIAWFCCGLLPALVAAQPADPEALWFPNKRVRAMVVAGDRVYLGGDFDYVGPPTGSFGRLDRPPGAAQFGGEVRAVADDGAGGWIAGGTGLAPDAASALRGLRADGQADPFGWPQPDGAVNALLRVGDVLYLGGEFRSVAGQPRERAAALDLRTRQLLPWAPQVRATGSTPVVLGLAALGGDVLLAGQFDRVGGQPLAALARVDPLDGSPRVWDARLPAGSFVRALLPLGDRVLIGGAFDRVDGQPRSHLAALDAATGAVRPWAPLAGGYVHALAALGDTVYAAGIFPTLQGQPRNGVGALAADSGQLLPFDARLSTNAVRALLVRDDAVWLGGGFVRVAGQPQRHLVAVHPQTGAALPSPWHASDDVGVLAAAADGSLVIGGGFVSYGGVPRHLGAAIDLRDGRPTAWDPRADGSLLDLALRDGRVYAAGCFRGIGGGADRYYVAELDAESGDATAWNPPVHDGVCTNTLAVDAQHVYVGGRWDQIGGRSQAGLARLSRATGALTGNNLSTGGGSEVMALALDEAAARLHVGGFFARLAGARRTALGELDLASGRPTAFNPRIAAGWVSAIARAGDTLYYGGVFDTVRGQARRSIAASRLASGALLPWQPEVDEPTATWEVLRLLVRPEAVYIGGQLAGGNPATQGTAAAVHPESGARLSWTLALRSGNETVDAALPRVHALGAVDGGILVGGGAIAFVGRPRVDFGFAPRAGIP